MTIARPPDALTLILYTAVLVVAALVTMRRPSYGVAALVAAQPFALYGDIFGTTITIPKVVLAGVLLGVASFPGAFAALAAATPRRILIAGVLVLAATAATFAQATYHAPVIRECLKALEYVVLFAVVVAAMCLDADRRPIRNALLGVTCVVALLALAQGAIRTPSAFLINGHVLPRVAGPLEGPNQLAGFFDVALPIAFAFYVVQPSALAMSALFLGVFADVLTFSRGGAFGAACGVVVVALVLRHGVRRAFAVTGAGLAAGFAVSVFWGVAAHTLALARFWEFNTPPGGGVGSRPVLWRAAIELWRRHPWFGIGAGNFELEIAQTGVHGVRTHANSLYLQSLVEGGIPLLAATLWLQLVSIASFVRAHRYSALAVGALGATIALAVHQTIDLLIFYPKVGALWWIVLGAGAAETVAAPAAVRHDTVCAPAF